MSSADFLLLDGKAASAAWKEHIRKEAAEGVLVGKHRPHLAAILVGDHPASAAYVAGKIKDCEEVGFKSTLLRFPADVHKEDLIEAIDALNRRKDVDGFIVQLPLPNHINEHEVLLAIDPAKDVDGFHPENVGRMALGLPTFLPATPYGILLLLEHFKIPTAGKHAVVVGRSHIVGSPISILLSQNTPAGNATVTLVHSRTEGLEEHLRNADLVVAAIGKPEFIQGSWLKPGAVVIDVGINRVERDGKSRLVGDVDFSSAAEVASAVTPVPGGVGLMTRVGLLMNTLKAAHGLR
jgi:methylenetetrahydrofolate dehydrogenase (NADP+)/methenyltetrahydrofolate cyclohydrolase